MVKKFRRAAAGIEEQLPSDLRTPLVLSQTCDYLFNEVVANAEELGRVHHFVWDRTRAIRNDFTILQVSSPEDLSYAVDCLERIARFHIISLHQMAGVKEKDFQYDWQQDREQLDRTLVSLMQYYDDSRGKIPLPNEPEFRAYLIVFQLQDPDMEDRVQSWPHELVQHPRIRKAMKLYAAAGTTSHLQGPLRPPATLPIAQQNWQRLWKLVASKRTSYLTACVAEINFNLIRRTALQALTKSVNQRATADFTTQELCAILELNDESETEDYLACYNVTFIDRDEGRFADMSALKSRQVLPEPSSALPKQLKSDMIEFKRFGRSIPAVISGFSIKEALNRGMVDEEEMGVQDADMGDGEAFDGMHGSDEPVNDGESLFMPETAKPNVSPPNFGIDFDTPPTSVFGQPAKQTQADSSPFGKPSTGTFGFASGGGEAAAPKSTPFNFLSGNTIPPVSNSPFKPVSDPASSPFSGFSQSKDEPPDPAAPAGNSLFTKKNNPASPFAGFNFTSATDGTDGQNGPSAAASPFGQPKQNASSSLFSQPPKPVGPPMPFVEDGSDSSAGNSPQLNEFPSVTSPPASAVAPSAKPAVPSFSFTAPQKTEPEPAKASSSPFAPFTKPEEGATQPNAAPSFATEAPAAAATTTSLATSNAKAAPPPKATSTPSFSFTGGGNNSAPTARRGSTSENFNRPAKPSPLAQSFTAATDAVEPVPSPFPTGVQSGVKSAASVSGAQQPIDKHKSAEYKPAVPQPDFASIVSQIAHSITLTSDIGLLDQFLEYYIGKVVTDAQEQVHFERLNVQADKFRAHALRHRYFKLWRDSCRRKRLARQGRERRKRNQQRLLESRSQASRSASLAESVPVLGRSQFGSSMGAKLSRQEEVDKMFQQSISSGRWSRMAKQEEQSKGGSKRPTSSRSIESPAGSRDAGHKRLKSTSHVDESGRVAKPAPTSHPTAGALKRSSFRETLSDNPPVASTTKSNYFRLKAMGRAHVYDLAPTHPRKRQHAEVTSSPGLDSPRKSVAHSPSQRESPPSSKLRWTSSSSQRSRHTAEDTDAIIARARAAREALRDGGTPLRPESESADPFRQSTGSQVLYDSPSLERARLDARWRASQGSDFGTSRRSDVPAYRLRESKFVPREQYGKAIDRAREMRQSRAGSRPESRIEAHTPSKPAEVNDDRPAQLGLNGPSPTTEFDGPTTMPPPGRPSHSNWPTATPSQPQSGGTPFDAIAQNSSVMQMDSFASVEHQSQLSGFENSLSTFNQLSSLSGHGFQPAHDALGTHGGFVDQAENPTNNSYQLGFANFPTEHNTGTVSNNEVNSLVDGSVRSHFGSVATSGVNGISIDQTMNGHQSGHISEDEEGQQPNPYSALVNGHNNEDEEEEDEEEMGEDEEDIDEDEEEEEEEEADGQHTLGHANSFSALANLGDDEEDFGDTITGVYPGAPVNGEYDDEDGDIEDEDEEDFDEDESDIDEDEEEEELGGDQYLDPRMLSQHQSPSKPNTQATTDSEVIELSD